MYIHECKYITTYMHVRCICVMCYINISICVHVLCTCMLYMCAVCMCVKHMCIHNDVHTYPAEIT